MKPSIRKYLPDHGGFSTKEIVWLSIIGLVATGTSIYLIDKYRLKKKANREHDKSDTPGEAAYYAMRIKKAFENDMWLGMGTNEQALFAVLKEIPSKQVWEKVKASYSDQFERANLMADFDDELDIEDSAKAIRIINNLPDKASTNSKNMFKYYDWAQRLKAAFDYTWAGLPRTDEEAIRAVFIEIPTQTDYNLMANTFQQLYEEPFDSALRSELEFWEVDDYLDIIKSKPFA